MGWFCIGLPKKKQEPIKITQIHNRTCKKLRPNAQLMQRSSRCNDVSGNYHNYTTDDGQCVVTNSDAKMLLTNILANNRYRHQRKNSYSDYFHTPVHPSIARSISARSSDNVKDLSRYGLGVRSIDFKKAVCITKRYSRLKKYNFPIALRKSIERHEINKMKAALVSFRTFWRKL